MTARWPQHHLVAAVVAALIVGPRWAWLVPVVAAAAWLTQPRTGWAIVAVVAVGLAAVGGHLRMAQAWDRAERPLDGGTTVRPPETVEVLAPPEQTLTGGWRFDGRLRGATVEVRTPVARRGPDLRTGALVRVRGTLFRLTPAAVGARSRGIALGLDATVLGVAGRRGGWRGAVDRVRERAERTLAFEDERPRTALLRGMVLGQDHAFGDEQEDAYRRSGLAHLVAASGQNVALVAAMVLGIGALIGVRRSWRLAGAIAAVAVYVPLAGAGPSIRRAGVMGVLTLLALFLGRIADRWWALLLAALVTVLADPFSPEQLGWQLSFAAVVGLLLLVDPLAAAAKRIGLPGWVGMALAVPVGAGVATAPVLAASVGDVSLTSLPANVIVEPLVAPVTWLGMAAGVLGPEARPVSGWAVGAVGPLLDWINGVAVWAAAPSWAVVEPGAWRATIPLLVVAGLLVAGTRPAWTVRLADLVRRWTGRRNAATGADEPDLVQRRRRHRAGRRRVPRPLRRAGALAAAAILVAVGYWASGPRGPLFGADDDPGDAVLRGDGVVVLAVGQGSATLLRQGDATILVDAGPPHGRVLDRLAEQGVERIDVLVLSHAAQDHTGGAPAVVRRLRPKLLVDGTDGHDDPATAVAIDAARGQGGQIVRSRRGMQIRSGPLVADVRWPPRRSGGPRPGEDPNHRATVIRTTIRGLRVLVPSDVEGPDLRHAAGGPVDLLVMPHHGSADDDVPALMRSLRPRLAVAQVGADNRYGHPAPSTATAVAEAGVPMRRTDLDGNVVVAAPDAEERR
ncbi:MAG: ComEC/Rec2 family competence protein [Patulibacter sp.]|nr:ComEC/Rec2 family competence protein [Patulibacter sp.]